MDATRIISLIKPGFIPFEPIPTPTPIDLEPGLRPTPMPTRPSLPKPTPIEKNLETEIISLIKPGFIPFEPIPTPTPTPLPIETTQLVSEPTNERRVIIKYIRYSDGKVFEIPITLESGKMYPTVMKIIKLDHGEIQSPIGLPNEELIRIVEERIESGTLVSTYEGIYQRFLNDLYQQRLTSEQPTPQIAEEAPTTVKRSPVVFWVIIVVCLVITFFIVKYFLKK